MDIEKRKARQREYNRRRHEEAKAAYAALMSCYPNGMKFNCHVSNLQWATQEENDKHALDTGLVKTGEDSYQAKLTNEQAKYIRDNPDKLSTEELAEMFGMSKTQISRIQRGKTYKNAGGNLRGKLPGGKPRIPDAVRSEVRRLRSEDAKKYTYKVLAELFGLHRVIIWRILSGK